MQKQFMLGIMVLVFWGMAGCSSIAYVTGYNLCADQPIEVKMEVSEEEIQEDPSYSPTAHTIAMIETGGGYLRKSPTLLIGAALSPLFFIVGTVSGALVSEPAVNEQNKPKQKKTGNKQVVSHK